MGIDKRIKEIRHHSGLTQKAFADVLGVKQNTIASYEIGRIIPSDAVVISACREFGINEKWLRTGEGKMLAESKSFSLDEFVASRGGTDLELEILKTYFEIDPKIRRVLVEHFRDHFLRRYVPETPEELEAHCAPVENNEQTG